MSTTIYFLRVGKNDYVTKYTLKEQCFDKEVMFSRSLKLLKREKTNNKTDRLTYTDSLF